MTVPTPVSRHNIPDLNMLEEACHSISWKLRTENQQKKVRVIIESTVYPGVTESMGRYYKKI